MQQIHTGIMGGTFNPIHLGHLRAAEAVFEHFHLNNVLFIPSGTPPHKPSTDLAPAEIRYNLISEAIASNPNFEVSRLEIDRPGLSYSVHTLAALLEQYGEGRRFSFIIGADILTQLVSWHDYKRLFTLCEFIVVRRPGVSKPELLKNIELLRKTEHAKISIMDMPMLEISSSDIRARLKAGKSVRYLVPESVWRYLSANRLYDGGGASGMRPGGSETGETGDGRDRGRFSVPKFSEVKS